MFCIQYILFLYLMMMMIQQQANISVGKQISPAPLETVFHVCRSGKGGGDRERESPSLHSVQTFSTYFYYFISKFQFSISYFTLFIIFCPLASLKSYKKMEMKIKTQTFLFTINLSKKRKEREANKLGKENPDGWIESSKRTSL